MTVSDQMTVINQFKKCAKPNPYQRYARQFGKLSPEEKQRTIENILAGDDPCVAIRDAKRWVREGQ
jgi:hypothetical protein